MRLASDYFPATNTNNMEGSALIFYGPLIVQTYRYAQIRTCVWTLARIAGGIELFDFNARLNKRGKQNGMPTLDSHQS